MSNLRRPPQKILQRHEALEVLKPRIDDIRQAIRTGLAIYNEVPPGLRVKWRARTRANALNDLIVHEAIDRLSGDRGVRINEDYDGAIFVVEAVAALRFKKIKDRGRPANYPTSRQLRIQQQEEIEGIPRATFVDVQYVPNAVWSEVRSISLACYRGQRLWEIPIAGDLESFLLEVPKVPISGPKVRSAGKKAAVDGKQV